MRACITLGASDAGRRAVTLAFSLSAMPLGPRRERVGTVGSGTRFTPAGKPECRRRSYDELAESVEIRDAEGGSRSVMGAARVAGRTAPVVLAGDGGSRVAESLGFVGDARLIPSTRSGFVRVGRPSGLGPRDATGCLRASPDGCTEVVVRREASVSEVGAGTLWKVQGRFVRPASGAR
jgi:hypothetical protein